MKADNVLELYDSFWFEHSIIRGVKYSSNPSTDINQQQIQDEPSDLKLLAIPSRSMSDNSFNLLESFSLNSVLPIHSSHPFSKKKDVTEDSNPMMLPKRKRMMRKHMSVPELEMEEVEGFMDLGFVFTEEDRNSRLASIILGLKRLGKEEEEEEEEEEEDDDVFDERAIQRPYLSETWEFLEWKKKVEKPLNWKIPEDMNNEEIMKDNLKLWAHSVASLVR